MLIRPTLTGLWFSGAQFVAVMDPHNPPEWSVAEIRETPDGYVHPFACGAEMCLIAYSEPPDREFPQRELVAIVGPFNPADVDLDGALTMADFSTPIDWDWNRDGGVSAQDGLDFMARFAWAISLPRAAGGC